MNRRIMATRLRAIADSDTHTFTELVRLSGLNPQQDFRHADLSRTDLRNQDLRAFDLTYANLRGAMTVGALFNNTVRRAQLSDAIEGVPVVVILIGERLLAIREELVRYFGGNVLIPSAAAEAMRTLVDAPMQRAQAAGVYLGDNTDLVRRRLSRHFRQLSRTLRASGACFILFEPQSSFEFDILDVVMRYLRKDGLEPYVFAFPQSLEREAAGAQIVVSGLRGIGGACTNMSKAHLGRRVNFYPRTTQRLSQIERSREQAIGFVWAVANARPKTPAVPNDRYPYGDGSTALIDGTRLGTESLASLFKREVGKVFSEYYVPERCHVFLRDDLYSSESSSQIAAQFSGQRTRFEFSVFPSRSGFEPEFMAFVGSSDSRIWDTLQVG